MRSKSAKKSDKPRTNPMKDVVTATKLKLAAAALITPPPPTLDCALAMSRVTGSLAMFAVRKDAGTLFGK